MATKLGGDKPTRSKAAIRTQTASWQYDSADYADGMDNKDHPSYKKLKQYSGNQHGGDAQGNFGRGPTRGNTGSLVQGPAHPPASAVPSQTKIKNPDYINGGAQVRTPGGTRSFMPSATENYNGDINRINFGRGPTKGNAQ
jgi:hypothetical protein